LGAVAIANAGGQTETTATVAKSESAYAGQPPLEKCPDGYLPADAIVDSALPAKGETQTPQEALNSYLSWNSFDAKSAEEFEFVETDGGALTASRTVNGETKALVQFMEIGPDYWVVEGYSQCLPQEPQTEEGRAA
ncbi:MAG: hypothetical protein M3P18_11820, partial [Actinomycetota bacterium]|nr:hypothetical protein [Actinomycetota bacterium]